MTTSERMDYRDLRWWGRLLYWRSEWFRSLCTDAWSYRRVEKIRLTRENRVDDERESSTDIIHEEWRIIDRWWTDEPIKREYRDVTRDGRRVVEFRVEDGEWQEAPAHAQRN